MKIIGHYLYLCSLISRTNSYNLMKPINRIFLFLLFISVSYAISYAQENQSYFLHTIEKGQSLYSISKMYNVTTSDIIRLNPGCDEKIYAGQTIKISYGKRESEGRNIPYDSSRRNTIQTDNYV